MKNIDIRELLKAGNLYVGQVEDTAAMTGVTVVLAPDGMAAGLDVRGGGPASRDTRVLDPLAAADSIHAIVLAGGSAFGLDAAGGVMRFLEERGVGLDVGVANVKVPLVCQSDIFDLGVGRSDVRPDSDMAYAACECAWGQPDGGNYRDGSYGAGCGATVGKMLGPDFMQKSGIGSAAVQVGPLMVGAIVVVNALGDVIDPTTGSIIAGAHTEDGKFADSTAVLAGVYEAQLSAAAGGADSTGATNVARDASSTGAAGTASTASAASTAGAASTASAAAAPASAVTNTTIGIIFTNAALDKAQLCKVAGMGHDGMARTVRPVHTSMDGDSLYAISAGKVPATSDIVGTLAAQVVAQAICRAVSVEE